MVRFRPAFAGTPGAEYDLPFARLDHLDEHLAELRFNVMWRRHTGRWWRLYTSLTLEAALHQVATDPVLRPPV